MLLQTDSAKISSCFCILLISQKSEPNSIESLQNLLFFSGTKIMYFQTFSIHYFQIHNILCQNYNFPLTLIIRYLYSQLWNANREYCRVNYSESLLQSRSWRIWTKKERDRQNKRNELWELQRSSDWSSPQKGNCTRGRPTCPLSRNKCKRFYFLYSLN